MSFPGKAFLSGSPFPSPTSYGTLPLDDWSDGFCDDGVLCNGNRVDLRYSDGRE